MQVATTNAQRTAKRRIDIVTAAWAMISERGYEATSLNALIAELGISKGSLYHHFRSKDAVVDAVVEMLTTEVVEQVAIEPAHGNAAERLCALLRSGWEWHEDHKRVSVEIMRIMLRPENGALLARINTIEQRVFRPQLKSILDQGVSEGTFEVPDADLATDLLAPMLSDALTRTVGEVLQGNMTADRFIAQLQFLQYTLERILGAKPNSLTAAIPIASLSLAEVQAFISVLHSEGPP